MTMAQQSGRLFVIGVGPGDPDLMTLKAVRLIERAEVIAYPATESGLSRARRTAADHVTTAHIEIAYSLPMSVDPGPAQAAYDDVSQRLREELDAGKCVALLCEGDPLFYGSAAYVYERLCQDYETEIVPAVTSLTACAAAAGKPLASRNDVVKVLPAPLHETRLRAELSAASSVAIVKVGRHFEKVYRVVDAAGLLDRAILIAQATDSGQCIRAMKDVAPGSQDYFSTILIDVRE